MGFEQNDFESSNEKTRTDEFIGSAQSEAWDSLDNLKSGLISGLDTSKDFLPSLTLIDQGGSLKNEKPMSNLPQSRHGAEGAGSVPEIQSSIKQEQIDASETSQDSPPRPDSLPEPKTAPENNARPESNSRENEKADKSKEAVKKDESKNSDTRNETWPKEAQLKAMMSLIKFGDMTREDAAKLALDVARTDPAQVRNTDLLKFAQKHDLHKNSEFVREFEKLGGAGIDIEDYASNHEAYILGKDFHERYKNAKTPTELANKNLDESREASRFNAPKGRELLREAMKLDGNIVKSDRFIEAAKKSNAYRDPHFVKAFEKLGGNVNKLRAQ